MMRSDGESMKAQVVVFVIGLAVGAPRRRLWHAVKD